MRPNPFQAPGSEHFNRMKGAFPTTPTDLFKPPQGGSRKGVPRQIQEENAEEAEFLDIPMEESASSEESPKAVLSDPGWVKPVTLFHEMAEVSVKLILPASKKHLTRVVAELHARTPDGPQYVVKAEGHADENGVAFVKLPIYQPQGYQGGPIEYFTVFKHVMAKALSTENHPRDVSEMAIKSADHTLIPGISFSKGTSFIGPQAAAGLKHLERKAGEWEKKYPKGQIVVFGHAEQDETDPKALSERRARSALAFITNDAATWESLYQSEAWGLIPLQVLLKDLGHYKDKVDGKDGPNTQAAFKAIQKQFGFPETGKADAATRMALFTAYMRGKHDIRLNASRFRTVAGNPWMGCAANNRVKDGENSEPENRRVVFLLLNESKHFPIYFYCQDGSETPCRQQCRREGKRSSPGIKCWFYDMLVREEKQNPDSEETAKRNEPPWLPIARREIGVTETKGKAHDPRIVEYHGSTWLKAKDDETAWCASFVNWCLQKAGQTVLGSPKAASWSEYGRELSKPILGSIAVVKFSSGGNHVGFVSGTKGGNILLLGGNQGGGTRVCISEFKRKDIIHYRFPTEYKGPEVEAGEEGGAFTQDDYASTR